MSTAVWADSLAFSVSDASALMSAFIKAKLKAARDLIAKKEFAKARDAAQEVLSYEPDNYNA